MKQPARDRSSSTRSRSSFGPFSVMALLIFLLSGSAGCLDVQLVSDIVKEIEGGDETKYEWDNPLTVNGEFDLQVAVPPTPDEWFEKGQRVYDRIAENLSTPDAGDPEKIKVILNEEGITITMRVHYFEVKPNTEFVSLFYRVHFDSFATNEGDITPGYFELRIHRPDGSLKEARDVPIYDSDDSHDTIALGNEIGLWSVEIGGTGFDQLGFSAAYSGNYELRVTARVQKDA